MSVLESRCLITSYSSSILTRLSLFIWRKPSASQRYGMVRTYFVNSLCWWQTSFRRYCFLSFYLLCFCQPNTSSSSRSLHLVLFFGMWFPSSLRYPLPISRGTSVLCMTDILDCILSDYIIIRLPPPLADVPTDAQYAMHIISQRITAGLDVRPRQIPKRKKSDNTSDVNMAASSDDKTTEAIDKGIDWGKWGNRFATGISVVNDIKRLKPASTASVWPPSHPLVPGVVGIAQPNVNVETHSEQISDSAPRPE